MQFLPALQLLSLFFGAGCEALTVMSIDNVIWVRTPYSVVHVSCWWGIVGLSSQAIGRWGQYVLTAILVRTNHITQSPNHITRSSIHILRSPNHIKVCILNIYVGIP